jgi:murein DD-endopeptidase MepM/ murein hydrolase activator NlpD
MAAERTVASAGYGWPVQPFDRSHPVRGNFGDPRTVFFGPPTRATLYRGSGDFSFHNGVDIAAPDQAPVYPVRDGTVAFAAAGKVIVRCGRRSNRASGLRPTEPCSVTSCTAICTST